MKFHDNRSIFLRHFWYQRWFQEKNLVMSFCRENILVSDCYFEPKMVINEVLIGNLTVIFLNDGFCETMTRNLWFHVFEGSKIETQSAFIEAWDFDWGRGRRPPPQSNTPRFNEYHLEFQFLIPQKCEIHRFLIKVSKNTIILNKKYMRFYLKSHNSFFRPKIIDLNTNHVGLCISLTFPPSRSQHYWPTLRISSMRLQVTLN